jgi:hypothetical protein
MRKLVVLCGCTLLPGCASARSPAEVGSRTETLTAISLATGETAEVRITRDEFISRAIIAAPRSAVWQALPDAFTDVGLPAPGVDPARWAAAVQQHDVRQRLGREPLSVFLDCGSSPAGANANLHRVRMDLHATLEAVDAGSTRVSFRLGAVARTTEGTSTSPVLCGTRGELERRIAAALQRRAGSAP